MGWLVGDKKKQKQNTIEPIFHTSPQPFFHHTHLAQILLHKLRPHHPDEGRRRVVGHRFGKHGFAGPRGAVQQHAARRVDAELAVQVATRQRQLHRFPHLLLLDVVAADVGVRDVGAFVGGHEGDGGIGFGGQHVDQGVGVAVQGDRGGRAQQLAVDGGQDADLVVGWWWCVG